MGMNLGTHFWAGIPMAGIFRDTAIHGSGGSQHFSRQAISIPLIKTHLIRIHVFLASTPFQHLHPQ
jgi:hypothetical protein